MTDTTLVDSNVLLDVLVDDPEWGAWSADRLGEALDDAVPASQLEREALPWDAGFLAGKAFLAYRRRGGTKTSPIANFYIGAHAAVAGYTLLSRDRGRYATHFPSLDLVSPT